MTIEPMAIAGAWRVSTPVHVDSRGQFQEWFRKDCVREIVGEGFGVAQANLSISRRNVVRGIHYSLAVEGQSKWVTCASGAIRDVIVDLRCNSTTFGEWCSVDISPDSGTSVIIEAGLGHGFSALTDHAVVAYLLTSPFSPGEEHSVNPLDPELGIQWGVGDPVLSERDANAPLLRDVPVSKLPS